MPVGCVTMVSASNALDDPVTLRALLQDCQMPAAQIQSTLLMLASQALLC